MKINFYKVHNDFGDSLPDKATFFNNPANEITRAILNSYYKGKGATDQRRFEWFKVEFNEFVASLKATKEKKDATK